MERFDLERNKRRRRHMNLRAEEFLRLKNEECSRDGREEFLKDILKKISINETVDSERHV